MPASSATEPKPSPQPEAHLSERVRRLRLALRVAGIACQAGVTILLAYLPFMLLVSAQTAGGRLVAMGFLFLVFALATLRLVWRRKTRLSGGIATGSLLFAALVCLVAAYSIAPTGVVPEGNFSSHYSGDAEFASSALSTIVPEIDQLTLGTHLVPYVDPVMDREQGARLRRLIHEVYAELRDDEAFTEAGSALGMCYDDAIWGERATLHFYEHVPRQLGRESYPVIVFLHGAMGNFKGYVWVLKELADAHGYAIIAPTYGAGMWKLDGESAVLAEIQDYITADPELDGSRMFLAGISNGGMGVTRGIVNHGSRYAGFLYISPIIELSMIMSPGFAKGCAGRPVFIVHGNDDRRIPADSVRASSQILASRGVDVTSRHYEGEDHFLVFSQRAAVLQDIADWLARCAAATRVRSGDASLQHMPSLEDDHQHIE